VALSIVPILVLSLSVPSGIGNTANVAPVERSDGIAAARAKLLASGSETASSSHLPALPPAGSNAESANLPNLRVPDTPTASSFTVEPEKKHGRRAWLFLTTAQHSAAAFDAYATRQAIGEGARELDPLMRPFANSAALYPASQVGPAFLDLLGFRMRNSRRNWARRGWGVPQTAATAGFIYAGVHDLGIRSQH
jgi:hypothetical protein